jgi:hypothetical protein
LKLIFILLALVIVTAAISGCVQPESPSQKSSEHVASAQWKPDGIVGENEYSQSMVLQSPRSDGHSGGRLEISWKNDAENLYIALNGTTHGWMSIGFEPTEWMKDADMIVGYVKGNNTTVLDEYCTGNYGPHRNDTELGGTYDILEYGGKEYKNYTVIEFMRRMNTGDKFDKAFVPGQNVSIIWAMASSKDLNAKHNVAAGTAVLELEK